MKILFQEVNCKIFEEIFKRFLFKFSFLKFYSNLEFKKFKIFLTVLKSTVQQLVIYKAIEMNNHVMSINYLL